MVKPMNQLDSINERMRTVGYLSESLLRVSKDDVAREAIKKAIDLLLDSVGQIIHPDDVLYMTPAGVA